MDFQDISNKALDIRNKYIQLEKKKYGCEWTREQIAQGFANDVSDLMKLLIQKSTAPNTLDINKKIAHELSDCLWSIIILANKHNINLEQSFLITMTELEEKIESELKE